MAEARLTPSPPDRSPLPSALFGWMPMVDACWQLQRVQWELAASWQRALVAAQKELLDEWVCRWGGGVPIDA